MFFDNLIFFKYFRQETEQGSSSNNVIGAKKGHQRRLSDPSSAIHEFMRMGILDKPSNTRAIIDRPVGTSLFGGSESDGLDSFGDAHCEIYAGDLLDEFEEAKYNPLWTMKGIESYQKECLQKYLLNI